MSDIDPTKLAKTLKVPVLMGLPEYLKDPASFPKVQKLLIQSLASKHSHGEVIEWATCVDCQKRFAGRGELLKKLGFKSNAQYRAWVKVHETIKERVVLPKYNT